MAFFLCSQANLFAQENKLNKEGEKEGIWKEYFKDGKLVATGAYKNGKKVGKWEEYTNRNISFRIIRYKNGKKQGK
ncbi:hypothetical protein [Labilibaculum euxinus]